MFSTRFPSPRSAGLMASLVVFAALGCGSGDELARRYPVSGTVTYNGKPVPKGSINFLPNDPNGRAAGGDIVEGTYSLTTQDPGDGAIPGQYKVTVTATDVDVSKEVSQAKQKGMIISQDQIAKAKRTNLIPSKYSIAETSGLTAQVKEGANPIDFDLKD
jgi:hypothetical protein